MTIELSSFPAMWSWLTQHFLLFFQWTDQITIGGVSLLKIGIGLTILTIVVAVVLPIIRTSPVDTGAAIGSSAAASLRESRLRNDPNVYYDESSGLAWRRNDQIGRR